MSIISNVLNSSFGKTIEGIGTVIKKFITTDKDRMEAELELNVLLQKRDLEIESTLRRQLEAKERILVAELQQGDRFTKRARPSVVYFGLGMIFINYCFMPILQYWKETPITTFDLPAEFWWAWGGIVATWSIGRTAEKRGIKNKMVSLFTGE